MFIKNLYIHDSVIGKQSSEANWDLGTELPALGNFYNF